MKFKGFWTRVIELQKESNRFLKDYWLAYILLVSVFMIPYGIYLAYEYISVNKEINKIYNGKTEEE